MSSVYASPPLNARCIPCSLRVICVEFSCRFRYKDAAEEQERRVSSETLILFPLFRLDVFNQQLWRDNTLVPVRPKPFAVLAYLAAHPDRLVTAAELRKAIWPDTYVSEGLLRSYIREVRQVLGDDPKRRGLWRRSHGAAIAFS